MLSSKHCAEWTAFLVYNILDPYKLVEEKQTEWGTLYQKECVPRKVRGENDDDYGAWKVYEVKTVLDESWFVSLLEAAAAKKPISASIATAKVRLHSMQSLGENFAPR